MARSLTEIPTPAKMLARWTQFLILMMRLVLWIIPLLTWGLSVGWRRGGVDRAAGALAPLRAIDAVFYDWAAIRS